MKSPLQMIRTLHFGAIRKLFLHHKYQYFTLWNFKFQNSSKNFGVKKAASWQKVSLKINPLSKISIFLETTFIFFFPKRLPSHWDWSFYLLFSSTHNYFIIWLRQRIKPTKNDLSGSCKQWTRPLYHAFYLYINYFFANIKW